MGRIAARIASFPSCKSTFISFTPSEFRLRAGAGSTLAAKEPNLAALWRRETRKNAGPALRFQEGVPNPAFGRDVPRPRGVVLELLAQAPDSRVQQFRFAAVLGAPHSVQQLLVDEHSAGIGGELGQQAIFKRPQVQLALAEHHPVLLKIECQLA